MPIRLFIVFCLLFSVSSYADEQALISLIKGYKQQGQSEQALNLARQAYALAETELGKQDPSYQVVASDYATLLIGAGKQQDAVAILTPLLTQQEQQFGLFGKQLIGSVKALSQAHKGTHPKLSRKYALRYQKLALRHYSEKYVAQYKNIELETTQQAKNLAQKLRKVTGKNYQISDGGQWDLIYNQDTNKDMAPVIEQLDLSYRSNLGFLFAFNIASKPAKHKFKAVYFENRDDYKAYMHSFKDLGLSEGADRSLGMYIRQLGSLFLFDRVNDEQSLEKQQFMATRALKTLRHEIAHQMFYQMGLHAKGVRYPRWIVEGFARNMEFEDVSLISGPQTENFNHSILSRLEKIRKKRDLPAIKDVVGMSKKTERNRKNTANVYEMGGVLVRFLYTHHPDKFRQYIASFSKTKAESTGRRIAHFYRYLGEREDIQSQFDLYLEQLFEKAKT